MKSGTFVHSHSVLCELALSPPGVLHRNILWLTEPGSLPGCFSGKHQRWPSSSQARKRAECGNPGPDHYRSCPLMLSGLKKIRFRFFNMVHLGEQKINYKTPFFGFSQAIPEPRIGANSTGSLAKISQCFHGWSEPCHLCQGRLYLKLLSDSKSIICPFCCVYNFFLIFTFLLRL